MGKGRGKKEGATTESPVDGQDQPRIYTIHDHTLEVLMHPDVLELHAVRVVHTLHGDERQLHLKVRARCGQEELVVDVLVDMGAQVSLVRRGLFKEELLQPSRRPVRLKVANGEIMGGGTHEATISMEFWEHERLNRPDLAKRSTLSGNFYVADITDWDMIMGYDFMVENAIGALPHRATLVREDNECLTWLSTDYACGSSQWNAEEENRIAQAVQAVGAKSRGDRRVQLTEYAKGGRMVHGERRLRRGVRSIPQKAASRPLEGRDCLETALNQDPVVLPSRCNIAACGGRALVHRCTGHTALLRNRCGEL